MHVARQQAFAEFKHVTYIDGKLLHAGGAGGSKPNDDGVVDAEFTDSDK